MSTYETGAQGSPDSPADIRPKTRWFWIGGAIVILGIFAAAAVGVFGTLGVANTVDEFQRVEPGTDTVQIDSTGKKVIYLENAAFVAVTSVEVLSPDGQSVPTDRYGTSLTYNFSGKSGRAISTFEADTRGDYTITTDANVAIGESIAGDLIRTIVLAFAIGGLSFLIGLIVIITTAVRRSNSKKRAFFATS